MDVRPINANLLKSGFEEDGHLSPYIEGYINACPTLNYEPVVHGEWIEEGGLTWCSQCKEKPLYDYFGRIKLSNCCHNCGAKMDGVKPNE